MAAFVGQFEVLEDFLADWSGREYVESAAQYFDHSAHGIEVKPQALTGVRDIVRDGNMRLTNNAL